MTVADFYPGVKFTGTVESWRRANELQPQSIIFVFDDVRADYHTVRSALLERYGVGSIDAIRILQKSLDEGSDYSSDEDNSDEDDSDDEDHSMIIEAHFANSHKRRQALAESMIFESLYLTINGSIVFAKALPMLPHLPSIIVYKVDNLPLRSANAVCKDVWESVARRIRIMSTGRRWFQKTLKARLVDVVPSYDSEVMTDKASKKPVYLFVGSIHVVLAKHTDLGKRPYFRAYGMRIKPTSMSLHYAYCKKCKTLDTHMTADCVQFPPSNEE
ncbi:hypothetical protein BJV82DRAFT_675252 [Fennellomyces sp. T-0311]|nr:hypothetical protein BJV82DRAFT_675252 [Fennellomyces sp. T-0311]